MRFVRRFAIPMAAVAGVVLAGAPPVLGAEADWRKVPHSSAEGTLKDVAVLGGGDAWAVGEKHPPYESADPVAEHWDGTSWKEVTVPDTPTGTGSLDGVSAVASNDVWAVGDSTGLGPVIRHWDGAAWTAVQPAAPPDGSHVGADRLNDIAAVSKTLAWAVGSFSGRNTPGPVTQLLARVSAGDDEAVERLFPLVYQQLRQAAEAVGVDPAQIRAHQAAGDDRRILAAEPVRDQDASGEGIGRVRGRIDASAFGGSRRRGQSLISCTAFARAVQAASRKARSVPVET